MTHKHQLYLKYILLCTRDIGIEVLTEKVTFSQRIAYILVSNYINVFNSLPNEDKKKLIGQAKLIHSKEWALLQAQLYKKLHPSYHKVIDAVWSALRNTDEETSTEKVSRSFQQKLEASLQMKFITPNPVLGRGISKSLLHSTIVQTAVNQEDWPEIPNYKILGWLGSGLSAQVYMVNRVDDEHCIQRALKVGDLTDQTRFEREVDIMTKLKSPMLLSALDYGVVKSQNKYWIEMPLLPGSVASINKLNQFEGLKLCLKIIEALKVLHAANIIHRDLKPSNILVDLNYGIKIADFGLSKDLDYLDATYTQSGTQIGSPAYMSPEAAKGEPLELSTDVWSIGVLMCKILTQKLPFHGQTTAEVWASILRDEPTLTELPSWLQEGVRLCLHKDPKKRPNSAKELKTILEDPIRSYLIKHERSRLVKAWFELIDRIKRFLRPKSAIESNLDRPSNIPIKKHKSNFSIILYFCHRIITLNYLFTVRSIIVVLVFWGLYRSEIRFDILVYISIWCACLCILASDIFLFHAEKDVKERKEKKRAFQEKMKEKKRSRFMGEILLLVSLYLLYHFLR